MANRSANHCFMPQFLSLCTGTVSSFSVYLHPLVLSIDHSTKDFEQKKRHIRCPIRFSLVMTLSRWTNGESHSHPFQDKGIGMVTTAALVLSTTVRMALEEST